MQKNLKKPKLLLPAGNKDSLRAAVTNGADAVYLGLNKFNARLNAGNFPESDLYSIVQFCHNHNVLVYIPLNILIKNNEIIELLKTCEIIRNAKADAIIIQDPCLIPIIKINFPEISIHLSTQATITNSYSIPKEIDRVILARELSYEEIKQISETGIKGNQKYETEIFVHGALCVSYSGQCIFSSIAGGRSGNRGECAQPCRKKYNNKYPLSTKDLCLIEKIPELINTGVSSFKIEGRMRSPLYVGTCARIYRKAIDYYFENKIATIDSNFNNKKVVSISENDKNDLMLAFNREFSHGFGFDDNIINPVKPMNRGIFLGIIKNNQIILKHNLKIGDGIAIWTQDRVIGTKVNQIIKDNIEISSSNKGDTITTNLLDGKDGDPVYLTSSIDLKVNLGDDINFFEKPNSKQTITQQYILPELKTNYYYNNNQIKKTSINQIEKGQLDQIRKAPIDQIRKASTDQIEETQLIQKKVIIAKVYNKKNAILADKAKADIIYYDINKKDINEIKNNLKYSKLFISTPRILSDNGIIKTTEKIEKLGPVGILIGNRGLLNYIIQKQLDKKFQIHLDYSFNIFNDYDLYYYKSINPEILPIISPELNFKDLTDFINKDFICILHGDLILMTLKQTIKAPELIDDSNRHFKVRQQENYYEILNSKQLGLFNLTKRYADIGINHFLIDVNQDIDKYIRIYRKILETDNFDDSKIKKGYTTGNFYL